MAAITSGEILWKYSVSAAAGNTTGSSAAASLGDQISTTAFPDATLNALFDDVSGAENAASTVDYRCLFIHNSNASNTLVGTKVWVSAETAGGASVAIATDNIAASALGSASAQAAAIGSETTAPSGVSAFSTPTTLATGLTIGDLTTAAPVRAFWVRRTAANTSALSNDGCTLNVGGDTGNL